MTGQKQKNDLLSVKFQYNSHMTDSRTVHVTFYKNGQQKWVTKTELFSEKEFKPDMYHPTRITPEEWEKILAVPQDRVQEILSQYYS